MTLALLSHLCLLQHTTEECGDIVVLLRHSNFSSMVNAIQRASRSPLKYSACSLTGCWKITTRRESSSRLFTWNKKHIDGLPSNSSMWCIIPFGKGTLEEKAAMIGVRYSTFHRMAHMVIDELISCSSEVIYIPRLEDQVFLKCARTNHA